MRLKNEMLEKELYYANYRVFRDGEIKYYQMKVVRVGSWDENHGVRISWDILERNTLLALLARLACIRARCTG